MSIISQETTNSTNSLPNYVKEGQCSAIETPIISQQIWDNFSSEKKKRIIEEYKTSPTNARKRYLEAHYGKENLISNNYGDN